MPLTAGEKLGPYELLAPIGAGGMATGGVAFLLRTPPQQQIAIASTREGRILRRFSINATEVRGVALSPDNQTLYYAAKGEDILPRPEIDQIW